MGGDRLPVHVARMFAELTGTLQSAGEMDRTLSEVVRTARETIGCEHAGVVRRLADGSVDAPALTGELVRSCDQAQFDSGEGPCLDAIDGGPVLLIDDMAAERRWPKFAHLAAELGVRSMLACRLTTAHGVRASLNLHATRPHAFDRDRTELAGAFAACAASVLAGARRQETLETALASRQTIGEATGVVMARYRLTSQEAFEVLVRASQHRNVKLRLVAAEVLRYGPQSLRPRASGRGRR